MLKVLTAAQVAELQIDSTTIKAHPHASEAAQKRGPQ